MSFGRGVQKKMFDEAKKEEQAMGDMLKIPDLIANSGVRRSNPFAQLPPAVTKPRQNPNLYPYANMSPGEAVEDYFKEHLKIERTANIKFREPSSNLTASTAISTQDLDDSFETARPYAPPLRPRGRGSWSYPSSRSSLGSHIMAQLNRPEVPVARASIGRGAKFRGVGRGIPLRTRAPSQDQKHISGLRKLKSSFNENCGSA